MLFSVELLLGQHTGLPQGVKFGQFIGSAHTRLHLLHPLRHSLTTRSVSTGKASTLRTDLPRAYKDEAEGEEGDRLT